MNFEFLIDYLFRYSKMKPQLGFAGKDKRAWVWLPGADMPDHQKISRAMAEAPIKGCTQLAYEDWMSPAANQKCEICWVGLDIDAEDNPGINLTRYNFSDDVSRVQASCSGKGVHLLYVLDKPIPCTHHTANRIVKAITAPIVAQYPDLHVCKADRRMFWLHGGENFLMTQNPSYVLSPSINLDKLTDDPVVALSDSVNPTPMIRNWAEKLGLKVMKRSTPVYVGDVVSLLRSAGETVFTKSRMRGNGNTNGYIDLTDTSISLFAYADGHTIWSLTDVEEMLK